jgi:adenosylcobinamide-GDP ribazoletransferase
MSPVKTIKTFRDLLSFLTIIPVGAKEDYIFGTAEHMYLFPLIGGLIGALAAIYFFVVNFVIRGVLGFINSYIALPTDAISRLMVSAMVVAFLLVITGLQHFDGLIDLGNTFGQRNVQDKKTIAHAWTVTYWGALLALVVEFLAFFSLFWINPFFAIGAIIVAEVSAKLSMVTIVWVGKPTHKGLGSIFLAKAKRKINIAAYAISVLIAYPFFALTLNPLLGLIGVGVVLISIPVGLLMEKVSVKAFGGVSGDTIGATNEIARSVTLLVLAGVLMIL